MKKILHSCIDPPVFTVFAGRWIITMFSVHIPEHFSIFNASPILSRKHKPFSIDDLSITVKAHPCLTSFAYLIHL